MAISSAAAPRALAPARPVLKAMAEYAVPSELKANGLVDGGLHGVGKLGLHLYDSYAYIAPARTAIAAVPGSIATGGVGAALGGVGKVLGKAGLVGSLVGGLMSAVVHVGRYMRKEETGARAAKLVAIDTTAGLGGGIGAALCSGLAAAVVGALGLAGLPLTIVGCVAGFIGYSWGDNLIRSKVFGYLDYLHDKQTGQVNPPPRPAS